MSRELKFRVWDKKLNKFTRGYDEEVGSFDEVYSDPPGIFFAGLRYLNEDSNRYIIQQYTGLKDTKGNDIYEGDLVELHTAANDHAEGIKENDCGLYEIYWDRKYKLKEIKPNWFLKVIDNDCANFNIMKVVGNVFENQELLN